MPRGDPFDFAGHGWRFERGDVKYVILDLLLERPSYGYEIIRALEGRFGGFYAPSPGAVYPTLQLLEEMGYVTSEVRDGRKVYTITEAGRRFLTERSDSVEDIRERMRGFGSPETWKSVRDAVKELGEAAKMFRHEAHHAGPDKMRRIHDVIMRAKQEIEAILSEDERSSHQ
jgi:DNA-binding PadR family transcriptional regulator